MGNVCTIDVYKRQHQYACQAAHRNVLRQRHQQQKNQEQHHRMYYTGHGRFAAVVDIRHCAHYAVALKYEEDKNGAPRVLAKGTGLVAAKIRELAAEHRIPTLEAPPLARALYQHVELGHEIPGELYTAASGPVWPCSSTTRVEATFSDRRGHRAEMAGKYQYCI